MQVEYKEIHWPSILTEFGKKDNKIYLHFKSGPKLKSIQNIDTVLDTHIRSYFFLPIEDTGKFIEEQTQSLDLNVVYSPKKDETVKFSRKSVFYNDRLPEVMPEKFKQTRELYQDLLKLYDNPTVIHKSYTRQLNGKGCQEHTSWDYIIHDNTPNLDEIMLQICEKANRDLVTQNFTTVNT